MGRLTSGFLITAKKSVVEKQAGKRQTDLMFDVNGCVSFVFIRIGQYFFILIGQHDVQLS